jgi:hypothetical protein
LGRGVLALLGEKEGNPVTVKSGRFGMYLQWKKVNAKMPPEFIDDPGSLPLDDAWALIEEKVASLPMKKSSTSKKNTPSIDLPPPPKRPLSAYLHFCAKHRAKVAESGKSLGEISKELAQMWAQVSQEEHRSFEALSIASKKEYEEKKALWEEKCRFLTKGSNGTMGRKSSSKVGNIKKPKGAYLYFCAAKRPEVAEKFQKLGDVSKELARMWRELEPTDREEYEELAAADNFRYENERMNGAEIGNAKTSILRKLTTKKKKKQSTQAKKTGVKTQRAPSAYMLFCAANRSKIVDEEGKKLPLGETTKRLAELWRNADDQVRSEFEARSAKRKEELMLVASGGSIKKGDM